MLRQFAGYLYNQIWPQIPANQFYGYRWQPGHGVPAALTIYNETEPGGVYVGFVASRLDTGVDFFARAGGPGPVFAAPPASSNAVTQMINKVRANPPASEAALFNNVTPQRLQDITGFLEYVNTCLTIINSTAAGTTLFTRINAANRPVRIMVGANGNQTFTGSPQHYQNTLTTNLMNFRGGQPLDKAAVNTIIMNQYKGIAGTLPKYNQLATDLNNMRLYSLFVNPATSQQNFLYSFLRYQGRRITGSDLMNWLSPGGFATFNTNVLTFARTEQAVLVRDFFLLALIITLYKNTPPNAGVASNILMNIMDENDNNLASHDFRPPAIGLSHELMHAMHYAEGNSPGADFGHFTTTAAELLFAGIGPFAGQAVSENAVRGQWGTIPGGVIDASNFWAAPVLRNIYEPPVLPETPATMRTLMHCI